MMIINKWPSVLLDADMCIKLGSFTQEDVLSLVLPLMAEQVYIHEYVWTKEILQPAIVRERLNALLEQGVWSILHENDLMGIDSVIYRETIRLLSQVMKGTEEPVNSKHWGEIVTLAMAKTKGIPVFMSDEKSLQPIVNVNLNSGAPTDIRVIRLVHVIEWMREHPDCGIHRKLAKKIWCGSCDRKQIDKFKLEFEQKIWPQP